MAQAFDELKRGGLLRRLSCVEHVDKDIGVDGDSHHRSCSSSRPRPTGSAAPECHPALLSALKAAHAALRSSSVAAAHSARSGFTASGPADTEACGEVSSTRLNLTGW